MENNQEQNNKNNNFEKTPNKEKGYPVRNFFKELKRVSWPTNKKNYKYFFWIFVFIIFLIAFFALISWGAKEILESIGAN